MKKPKTQKLLNIDANAKTAKGRKQGYMTGILYLLPSDLSGYNVCPNASRGCIDSCLNLAGKGKFTATQNARLKKTLRLFQDRRGFIDQLEKEIRALKKRADKKGLIPVVRLNGTSDFPWVATGIFKKFPKIQFYDYTKTSKYLRLNIPNYYLTFSRSEKNHHEVEKALQMGHNVAVVFEKFLPKTYLGYRVFNGDESDLRFLDPASVVVGLKAKGPAKHDTSGFVVCQ
tara:strand:+ start:10269 stop:10955 length:687 start_codon:yes stop_codon:yes gene_type:complete